MTAILGICLFMSCRTERAGEIRLTVQAGAFDRQDCAVSVELPDGTGDSDWELSERQGWKRVKVPSQILKTEGKTIVCWILTGRTKAGDTRTFAAKPVDKQPAQYIMDVEDTQQALVLKKDGKAVLQYNYTYVEPPAGVDTVFRRSGFIHPAWSPAGNVLTNIQPKDHYHHFGIWNPWTRVVYDGTTYDLWNLGERLGTVRAGAIRTTARGMVFSGYDAALDHVIFTPEGEKTVMEECWKVKTWNIPDIFLWDFESHLYPSTPLPVLLEAYRYAGFSCRATPEWTGENCAMLTSEGKTRQEIDGTAARWICMTGDTQTGRSGLLFMSHPQNCNAPEPLRIWDKQANGGRGDVFINFSPTKNRNWELASGKHYLLRYRVVSYEGEMTSATADRLWNDFAHPPVVEIR
ncbi:MAG: PmoA family protein [Tannerella sp.]|nr:PmoA family protein [Tannerella sp.]